MDSASKYQIVEKIIQSQDDVLLTQIKAMLDSPIDFWDSLPVEIKEAIWQSKAELDNGHGIAHQDVMAEINHRFLK